MNLVIECGAPLGALAGMVAGFVVGMALAVAELRRRIITNPAAFRARLAR